MGYDVSDVTVGEISLFWFLHPTRGPYELASKYAVYLERVSSFLLCVVTIVTFVPYPLEILFPSRDDLKFAHIC